MLSLVWCEKRSRPHRSPLRRHELLRGKRRALRLDDPGGGDRGVRADLSRHDLQDQPRAPRAYDVVAAGLPGAAPAASPVDRRPLGLRPRGSPRPADRERQPGATRSGRDAQAFRRAFPVQAHPVDRRLRFQRQPLDGRQQHVCIQLPLRRRDHPMVRARVRPRDRHQPDPEPVRLGLARLPERGLALRRPDPPGPRDDPQGRCRRTRLPLDRLEMGGLLVGREGLPALFLDRALARPGRSDASPTATPKCSLLSRSFG